MEAIVLAGGLGTRLRKVISDVPKPMAPISERPFLEYIFDYLSSQGIKKIILSTGYKHELIEAHFGSRYRNISIGYSVEKEPLGTGGAIKMAFYKVGGDNVFIVNGDTFFNVNLMELQQVHLETKSELTISLKPMRNFDRYGVVVTEGNRVIDFKEKEYQDFGNINGGIYLTKATLFDKFELPSKFSFETDFMEKYMDKLKINAYTTDQFFIDIGIPEDYQLAQNELMKHI